MGLGSCRWGRSVVFASPSRNSTIVLMIFHIFLELTTSWRGTVMSLHGERIADCRIINCHSSYFENIDASLLLHGFQVGDDIHTVRGVITATSDIICIFCYLHTNPTTVKGIRPEPRPSRARRGHSRRCKEADR